MALLIIGLIVFLGVHSVAIVAPGWRDAQRARMGEGAWKGVFTLASVLGLVLIVYGYGLARQAPVVLYTPPTWSRHLAAVLLLPVFPLLLATYLPGRIKSAAKHPTLLATKLWAHPVSIAVEKGEAAFGILLCGSANGVAITANKHQGVRAAICWGEELAELARKHNDANIICIPARFVRDGDAEKMLDIFMNTAFEGGRHANRVNKIAC